MTHGCDIIAATGLYETHRGSFYARCDCGWISANRRRKSEAIGDARAHLVMVAKRDVPQTPEGKDTP